MRFLRIRKSFRWCGIAEEKIQNPHPENRRDAAPEILVGGSSYGLPARQVSD